MGEILINQLFAGAYLQEGTNIGHEVINLFKDDNNENYLFITPSGKVNDDHDVDRVLFVQNIKARETMEVVMKAEELSRVTPEEIQKIYYAGVNIVDIFKKNVYHGEADAIGIDIMATHRAQRVCSPAKGKRIIITVDPDFAGDDDTYVVFLGSEKNKIVGQGMRTYLSEELYQEVYEKVDHLLRCDGLWDTTNSTQKLIQDGSYNHTGISFLEIIRKENDELIMSNLLAYYFNYNHSLFVKFTEEILGIKGFGTSFEIIRESMKNIDLWIRDEKHVIVIENKIKSGLNGKTDDGKTQLDKYYEFAEQYKSDYGIDEAYYYIFAPNYNDLSIDESAVSEKYKVIYYSEIYDFFRKYAAEYLNDKYFPDFLGGLKNQTMTFSELRFSIMRSRFLEKINQR